MCNMYILDVDGRISVETQVISVMEGSNCTLSCHTDSDASILWHFGAPLDGPFRGQDIPFLYNGFSFSEKFDAVLQYSVSSGNTTGRSNLEIISARSTHAGKYSCQEAGSNELAALELIVLGKTS